MRKASRIKYWAFEGCGRLDRVPFRGTKLSQQSIETVEMVYLKIVKLEIIDLTLSSRQSMM